MQTLLPALIRQAFDRCMACTVTGHLNRQRGCRDGALVCWRAREVRSLIMVVDQLRMPE